VIERLSPGEPVAGPDRPTARDALCAHALLRYDGRRSRHAAGRWLTLAHRGPHKPLHRIVVRRARLVPQTAVAWGIGARSFDPGNRVGLEWKSH